MDRTGLAYDSKHYRHWCPISETFTGGDSLLTALDDGWEVRGVIFKHRFWFPGNRYVLVYRLTLWRPRTVVRMTVIDNPFVNRVINQLTNRLVAIDGQGRIEDVQRTASVGD